MNIRAIFTPRFAGRVIRGSLLCALCASAVLLSSGCASMLVAQGSRERIVERRAIQAHAIPGGAAIGIDLLSLDVLAERPLLQLGAAVLDAGVLYGAYEGLQSLKRDDTRSPSVEVTGDGNTVIIQGDQGRGRRDDIITEAAE